MLFRLLAVFHVAFSPRNVAWMESDRYMLLIVTSVIHVLIDMIVNRRRAPLAPSLCSPFCPNRSQYPDLSILSYCTRR